MMRWKSGTGLAVGLAAVIAAMAGLFQFAEQRRLSSAGKIEIAGGGFLYNYRIGEIRYGISIQIVRPVPIGTTLEVVFENPAGGPPFLMNRSLGTDTNRIPFESPAISGLIMGQGYKVSVRLRDRDSDAIMETLEATYQVTVDPDLVPAKPLIVGPGYRVNPD